MQYHADHPLRCVMKQHEPNEAWFDRLTPQYVLVLILEGELELRRHPADRIHVVRAGEAYQRLPDQAHQLRFRAPSLSFSLAVPAAAREALAACGTRFPQQLSFPVRLSPGRMDELRRLHHDWRHPHGRTRDRFLLRFTGCMLDLLASAEVEAEPAERWHDACDLLAGDLGRRLSMPAVAESLGMNYHRFRATFTRRFGCSPSTWRSRRRLDRACDLLQAGCRLDDIADELGYHDASAFSRHFKHHHGCSPGAWVRRPD